MLLGCTFLKWGNWGREVEKPAQVYLHDKWHGWDLNQGCWATVCKIRTSMLYDSTPTKFGVAAHRAWSHVAWEAVPLQRTSEGPVYPFEFLASDAWLENIPSNHSEKGRLEAQSSWRDFVLSRCEHPACIVMGQETPEVFLKSSTWSILMESSAAQTPHWLSI